MDLYKISNIANNVDWVRTFDFNVLVQPVLMEFGALIDWTDYSSMNDVINGCLKSINLPQYTGNFEELLIAGKFHFARVTNPVFQVEMTFRDFANGSLYKKFVNAYILGPNNYSEKTNFAIIVKLNDSPILETYEAQLSDVSQLQLSHENTEIMEFSVSFKMNLPATLFRNTSNSLFADASRPANRDSNINSARNIFSNVIKNGLSLTQNTIIDGYKSILDKW